MKKIRQLKRKDNMFLIFILFLNLIEISIEDCQQGKINVDGNCVTFEELLERGKELNSNEFNFLKSQSINHNKG